MSDAHGGLGTFPVSAARVPENDKTRLPLSRRCLFGADSAVKGGANRELAATILRPRAGVVKLVNTADFNNVVRRKFEHLRKMRE